MNKRRSQPSQYLLSVLLRLKRASSSESGFIIFITIGMVLLLGFLWTASALLSKVDTARADATENSNTGFYGAEYGLNKRAQEVRSTFEGYNLPSGTSPANWQACLDSIGSNDGSGDFQCETSTLTSARSTRGSQRVTTLMRADVNNPSQINIPTGEPFAGLNALEYKYSVDSVAINANRLNLPSAILGLDFKSRLIPLFQFAAFYNDDLDFYIPPNMTLNGRVHTNADLYLNAAGSNTLSINGQVSAAGVNTDGTVSANPLIRGEKDGTGTQCSGTVRIMRDRNNGWQSLSCNGSSRQRYRQSTTTPSNISTWGTNLQLSVPKLNVPAPGEFAPSAGSTYWDAADLRLVLNVISDNTILTASRTRVRNIEVQNSDGSQNVAATTALNSCSALALNTGTAISTTLSTAVGSTSTTPDLTVASTSNLAVGDALVIGSDSTTDWDGNVISSISGTTLTLRQQVRENNTSNTGQAVGATVKKAVVSSSDTFYNFREKYAINGTVMTGGNRGQYIRMLNVDVRQLLNCAYNQPNLMGGTALNDTTEGGLVWYMTVKDNTGNTNNFRKYGIRLYNGRSLRSTIAAAPEINGLTIVSNQAVYLQGNYNLKDDATTSPASVANDPATTGITETWRPAAILADTINILSNSWRLDDYNGTNYITATNLPESQDNPLGYTCLISGSCGTNRTRTAPTETWMNVAFLAGTFSPASEGDPVTGGLNNYPLFHENWNSSVDLNYRGSFVSLKQPDYTVAPFCGSANVASCNIYNPPIRNWDFETTAGVNNAGFNNASNLPPLTPRVVYLRQEVFRRSYDRASLNSIPNPFAFLPSPSFNFGITLPGQR